jgi:hypothetical protein
MKNEEVNQVDMNEIQFLPFQISHTRIRLNEIFEVFILKLFQGTHLH